MKHAIPLSIAAAIASVLAVSSNPIQAAQGTTPNIEKCAGVIKGGANDCGTSIGGCHGSVKVDKHPEAWIELPAGSCDKIAGAKVTNSPYAIPGGKAAYEASKAISKR